MESPGVDEGGRRETRQMEGWPGWIVKKDRVGRTRPFQWFADFNAIAGLADGAFLTSFRGSGIRE
ncbi:MAG: hypothetical protein NVSMB9_07100 [Isosphaeraceae bacterium]